MSENCKDLFENNIVEAVCDELGLAGAQAVQWREAQLRLCVLATGAALAEVCSASSGLCNQCGWWRAQSNIAMQCCP